MNEHEAERIAAAINIARPDWPTASVLTLIRKKLLGRPRRDVFVALAWVASDADTKTPARVVEQGPWWKAAGVESSSAPRIVGPTCVHCGYDAPECARRWSTDHKFEGPNDWMRRRPEPDVPAAVAVARDGIAAAREADRKARLNETDEVA